MGPHEIEARATVRALNRLANQDRVTWAEVVARTWALAEARAAGATWQECADVLGEKVTTLKSAYADEVRELTALLDGGVTLGEWLDLLGAVPGPDVAARAS